MYFEGRLGGRFKIWCESDSEFREALKILKAENYNWCYGSQDTPIGLVVGLMGAPHRIEYCPCLSVFQNVTTFREVNIHLLREVNSLSSTNSEMDVSSLTTLVDSMMK